MKFANLVSALRGTNILRDVLADPRWAHWSRQYADFDRLAAEMRSDILRATVPDDLMFAAMARFDRKFVVQGGVLRPATGRANEHELSALEVCKAYGGDCIEEVLEYGSVRVMASE